MADFLTLLFSEGGGSSPESAALTGFLWGRFGLLDTRRSYEVEWTLLSPKGKSNSHRTRCFRWNEISELTGSFPSAINIERRENVLGNQRPRRTFLMRRTFFLRTVVVVFRGPLSRRVTYSGPKLTYTRPSNERMWQQLAPAPRQSTDDL